MAATVLMSVWSGDSRSVPGQVPRPFGVAAPVSLQAMGPITARWIMASQRCGWSRRAGPLLRTSRRGDESCTAYGPYVAHTFEELVEKQRAADQAHATAQALRTKGDPPAYETAWQVWRDLAKDVQGAVTVHAKELGTVRAGVELEVKKAVRLTE